MKMYTKSDGTEVAVRKMATPHLESALKKATDPSVQAVLQEELSLRLLPRWTVRVQPPDGALPQEFGMRTSEEAWKLRKEVMERPDRLVPPIALFPAGTVFSVEYIPDANGSPAAQAASVSN